MNETLQKSLAEIISKATEGVTAGINFLSAQLPDVIHQLLVWKFVENLLYCLGGILILGCLAYGLYKTGKIAWAKTIEDSYDMPWIILWALPSALISIFVVAWAISLLNIVWLEIWFAPKIYLIEYAAKLIKGN